MLIEKITFTKKVCGSYFIGNDAIYKESKKLTKDAFISGWEIKNIYKMSDRLYLLHLMNKSEVSDAIWYLDENKRFIGNNTKANIVSKVMSDVINSFYKKLFTSDLRNETYYYDIKALYSAPSIIRQMFFKETLDVLPENVVTELLVDSFFDSQTNQQDEAIAKGHVTLFCEETRELLTSKKSIILNDHIVVYYFLNKSESSILYAFYHSNNSKLCLLYWPKKNKVKYYKCDHNKYIAILRHHIFINFFPISKYLSNQQKSDISCLIRSNHIGHHLWNDLTGISRIFDKKIHQNISQVIVFNSERSEHYGSLENFFPGVKFKRGLNNVNELASYIYKENIFLVRVSDELIKEKLINKILKISEVSKSKSKNKNITILIGFRFENRTWLNQVEGIVFIINYLCDKYENKKFKFIIDGHNKNRSGEKILSYLESSKDNIENTEIEAFEYIRKNCNSSNSTVSHCLGYALSDNIRMIYNSDFFIAPWGAGLVKYKWICNLPGIVFTSRYNLEKRHDLDIYDNDKYREKIVKSTYLDVKSIQDEPGDSEDPSRSNFIVDVEVLTRLISNRIDNEY